MANQQLSPYLSHLNASEVQELIDFYYTKEFSVSELLEMFQIPVSPSQLVSCFPPYEDLNIICPHCEVPMFRKWNSRTSPGDERLSSDSHCLQCGHKDFGKHNWRHCDCPNCLYDEQVEQDYKDYLDWEDIYKVYGRDREFSFQNDISQIDLKSAIYLLAMERQSVSGEIGIFSPLSSAEVQCTHGSDFTLEIINYLTKNGYMRVDPFSEKCAFDLKSKSIPWYAFRAQYYANLGSSLEETKNNIKRLERCFFNKQWIGLWHEQLFDVVSELWRKISLYECLEYLNFLGYERCFNMPQGDKTKVVLENALKDQPTAVVYSFIWTSVVKASDYYQSKNISLQQAANSVVGNIQSGAEKVRLGDWEPRGYGRQKGFRNSALFEVLFNLVLQVGDAGFKKTFDECLTSLDWALGHDDEEE